MGKVSNYRSQIDRSVRLEPGDLVFTRGTGLISHLIRWASRHGGESKTVVNHVGVISDGGSLRLAWIAEARWKFLVHSLWDAYVNTGHLVAIYRAKNLTPDIRRWIASRAASFRYTKYGWAKIVLHALDKFIGGRYFFRRLAFLPNRPICSYAAAVAYSDYGLTFGVKSYEAQPDDIWDYVVNSDNYRCVRPLSRIEESRCPIPTRSNRSSTKRCSTTSSARPSTRQSSKPGSKRSARDSRTSKQGKR